VLGRASEQAGVCAAQLALELLPAFEVRGCAPRVRRAFELLGCGRGRGRGQRPVGAGAQIGPLGEYGKLLAQRRQLGWGLLGKGLL
jgi:hypothetical protein